ncbi:restriction endonuclease subunit S, partial [Zunongwangia profunda]
MKVQNEAIPEDWKLKKIGDLATVTAGGTPSTKNKNYWGGEIPWMNSGEINLKRIKNVEGRITDEGLKNSSTKLIPIKSILMALAGQGKTRGKVAINEIKLCTNQSLAAIFNLKNINTEFLFQNLDSRYNEIRKMSTGDNGRGGLNLKIIKNIKVPLPPLPEQQKIADILSTVDEKIAVIDQQITATEELKKGLMQRLLTKGIGHTEFKDSPLGKIPKSWEVKKISEIADFRNGKGHEKIIDENGDYIVVNSKFISSDGKVIKKSNQNLSPLNKGDIAMVMSDVPNGKALSKCYLVDENDLYTLNQRICLIKAKDMINNYFLYLSVNRNRYFLAFDNGVGQTNLKKSEVLD